MLSVMSSGKESWDIGEFQYQCYNTDLCTFPKQFCSSDSKRCDECKFKCDTPNEKFPLACRTFCDRLGKTVCSFIMYTTCSLQGCSDVIFFIGSQTQNRIGAIIWNESRYRLTANSYITEI